MLGSKTQRTQWQKVPTPMERKRTETWAQLSRRTCNISWTECHLGFVFIVSKGCLYYFIYGLIIRGKLVKEKEIEGHRLCDIVTAKWQNTLNSCKAHWMSRVGNRVASYVPTSWQFTNISGAHVILKIQNCFLKQCASLATAFICLSISKHSHWK